MRIRSATLVLLLTASHLAAQDRKGQSGMDYGGVMMTTFEGGGRCGTTEKGLVVRLGDRGAFAFDTELLRMSAAWTDGWLRLRGTAYDGSHGPMPKLRGNKVAETKPAPGWANGGDFTDPRPIPHGPLPRSWGQYEGMWRRDGGVVVGYRIGDMQVRESFAIGEQALVVRTLELGPSKLEQRLLVLDGPGNAQSVTVGSLASGRGTALQWQPEFALPVELAASIGDWSRLPMGGPASGDYLDAASGTGATVAWVPGFARAHGSPEGKDQDAAARLLPRLHDGEAARNNDDWQRSVWFDKHKVDGRDSDDGRLVVDLQRAVEVSRIHTYSWHGGYRSTQQYDVYGSAADGAPDAAAADPTAAGWTKVAEVDSGSLGEGDQHGVAIAGERGLGSWRHLLFVVRSGSCFFSELDVYADSFRAAVDATGRSRQHLAAVVHGAPGAELSTEGGRIVLRVPPHAQPLRLQLRLAAGDEKQLASALPALGRAGELPPLPTAPQPAQWGEPIVTKGERGADDGPFAVDTITIPLENRFESRMRTAAFDFFRDGRAAVSTWNGDVWIVSGIDDDLDRLEWKRFATGLFDPLGLRIVDDVLYVHGRDGLTKLHDTDGNGEADHYECFNNQVYITPAFHEFAFDLQTDAAGNFYFSKGAPVNPGGRGFMKIVPHHGAILKVSKDGSSIETVATGLRAPNGIGVSPTGILTSGDNEGTYMPRCRLNWITKPGFYAGVQPTAHRTPAPDQPDLPLCWMPMEVDNSSGGQVWVTGKAWADLDGRLLHLSYGTCSTYLVLKEEIDGVVQGGVVRLPANFSSSCMRGRFSAADGQLYVIGLQGWQTSAAREGGFHRVRRTGQPLGLPTALRTGDAGVYLTFAEPLDAETAADPENWSVEIWNYLYSPNYGSPELSVLHPERKVEQGKENRDPLPVRAVKLSADGRTAFLAIEGMRPVHQMKITWNLDGKDGRPQKGELHHTIHVLQKDPGFPSER
ncbi:MAG: hypothetical protein MUC36_21895 [Planctomycetes bacterium]|nr:hypothetical protein [Planctomycetota bacterium]